MSKEQLQTIEQSEDFDEVLGKHARQIREKLQEAMRALLSNVDPSEKVGVALSGGVDSTIVAYLLQKSRNNNIAFSLHVEGYEAEDRDIEMAKKAAIELSLDHRIMTVSPDQVIQAVEPVVKMITLPGHTPRDFNVYSGILTYLLGKEVKQAGVKKCFSGEGADELSGSYGPSGSFGIPHEEMVTIEMREKLFRNITEHGYLRRTDETLGAYGIEAVSPYLDRDFADVMLRIPPEFFSQDCWKLPLVKAFEHELPESLRDNLYRPKVRAQVGSGIFSMVQKAGYDQQKLEEIFEL